MLVCYRKNRLYVTIIRKLFLPVLLQILEKLAQVQYPNIANILNIYFHDSKLYIISEYLDVSVEIGTLP